MRTYSAEQIYGFALSAGFAPDAAATMTAIALAESGGNPGARNSSGEDSRGLWQINAAAHPDLARRYDLYDPVHNARAAFEVSGGGADVSPWTVTHHGASARYLQFRDEAQDAAVAAGQPPGLGVWTGTAGYGHPLAPGGGSGGGAPALLQSATGDNAALDRFLEVARDQIGDRYVFGAEVDLADADPEVFDCSEFTQWAAGQAGVELPDGATQQYLHLKKLGVLVPVEEAKNTPGALLFSFDREPRLGDGRTPGAHVAISLGDGATVEARNSRDGVGQFTSGDRFQYAAVIPGISDGEATVPPATLPPVEPQPLLGGADTDQDGLSDAYEQQAGFDAANRDTDRDNLPDGYEAVVLRTNPMLADSDADGLSDAFEIPSGLDPNSPDTDRDGHLDGSFAAEWQDDDRDGLDNRLEQVTGFDPTRADSDNDGIADKLELQSGADPAGDQPAHPLGAAHPLGPADPLGTDPYDSPVS
ncbi:transglycosylase SLT domain-containing protein [Actinoplanes sp. NPDC049599]|uniref:transglycosylase SLT domain-containing protein n=1 Tax=Actinoplanes sp. NPDC049599 TaxID=3363903 RepID=UPI00379CE55E